MIIVLFNCPSFLALNNICLLILPHGPCSTIHFFKLFMWVSHCFPLPFIHSRCPVSVKFVKLSFLNMYFRKFQPSLSDSVQVHFFYPIFLKTSSSLTSSVLFMVFLTSFCRMISLLPQVASSAVSKFYSIGGNCPYKTIGVVSKFSIFFS